MTLTLKLKKTIINLFELGLSSIDIATFLNIDALILAEWIIDNDDLKKSSNIGIKATNLKVTEALINSAVGHQIKEKSVEKRFDNEGNLIIRSERIITKDIAPNFQSIKYWLSNRDESWKEDLEDAEKDMNINIRVEGKDIIIENNNEE